MTPHWSKPASTSTAHTAYTATTAPTSLDTSSGGSSDGEREKERGMLARWNPTPPDSVHDYGDADAWFARFRSDQDLSLDVTDECPDRATLAAAYDVPVYSADGHRRPFGSLYDPAYSTHRRQLVLFVRHFYCGACQAYLQAIADAIPMSDYFAIPVPTSVIVIGCGQPDLIPHYKQFTRCPFPIFADPSRQLYKTLGMVVSANMFGKKRPDYMRDIGPAAWVAGQAVTIQRSLKDPDGIRKRDVFRGGHPMQIGGEFLFDDGEVVWCHRMKNYRNHAEVAVLRKLLELDE